MLVEIFVEYKYGKPQYKKKTEIFNLKTCGGHTTKYQAFKVLRILRRMSTTLVDALELLSYAGPLKSDSAVKDAINAGPKSKEFTELIEWFSEELQSACGLDSYVNAITDPEDVSSFLMEVSSLLKELHCPYKSLVSGPISQRLLDVPSRNVLLDFLCTELQAARLLQCKTKKKRTLEIEMDDSTTATSLMNVIEILGIPKEFAEDPNSVLPEIEKKVNEKVSARPELLSEPAFKASLTENQWAVLENLFGEFEADYTVRRELLITRLDVTIQSFQWGDGSKGKEHRIVDAYMSLRNKLKKHPSVKLTDILAARESIFIIEKTSSAELVKNTKSQLNRVLIPAVPDRGGRPKEQRPPVEMPNWMKRSPGSAGGGRGDRHGGGWQGQGKKFRGGHGHKSGGRW